MSLLTFRIFATLAGIALVLLIWWDSRRDMTPDKWFLGALLTAVLVINPWIHH